MIVPSSVCLRGLISGGDLVFLCAPSCFDFEFLGKVGLGVILILYVEIIL